MSCRPDLHTPGHDQWDQGGYCNNLVVDDDGCGTVCGYRAPRDPHAQTVETLIAEARDIWEADDLYPDQMIPRLVKALESAERRAEDAERQRAKVEAHTVMLLRNGRQVLDQRNQLAAVIEKAEDYVTRHYLDTRFGDEVLPILATVPADALEAADQRAAQAEAELKDAYRTDIPSLKEQRDELAAVVEKAEDYVTRHYLDTRFGDEVLPILATVPADALRELKAKAWDEGYFRRMDDYPFDPEERDNPYREDQS